MSSGSDSVKSIMYALIANFTIAIAKLGAAFVTSSGAMMAEAVHSFADCGNQVLLLIGLKQAKHPPTPDYPLGFGKSIYFWSFIVALILFSMGGLFSIYEGVHKLHEPEALKYPLVAIAVLLFGIFAEGASLSGCLREINKDRGDQSLWRWFRDSRKSELVVIFGEDLAALIGLTFALIAISLSWLTGDPTFDAVGSIGIGVLLVIVAFFVGVEVKALLIGQGVEPREKEKMLNFINQRPEVDHIFNLLTLQMGNDVMVAVKAKMSETSDVQKLLAEINQTEKAFKMAFPQVLWLFFEPDNED
ncbi:MAG: cation diffusion facilitator family transporter [Pseudomonadales bacterium]|nr:cation diffusion facilitator family transporter [Pseudomonadales bacterium]